MFLSDLIKQLEGELSAFHRVRTMKAYGATLRSVLSFTHHDMELGEVFNPVWLFEYQLFLQGKGLKQNTISFYMRMLRSIHNKAVDAGLHVSASRLFFRVFTGLAATTKRSISPKMIRTIAKAEVSKKLEFCRDAFMLCFYLQGMTFIDLAYLKKTDIQGNQIVYQRRKTRSTITVSIRKEAQRIINKYAHQMANSAYVFPIIVDPKKNEATQYQSALHAQNRKLKELAKELKLDVCLTTYVARHSWATMAHHNKVPTALISEALGHKTEEVTRIYLASFGVERLSQANEMVVQALNQEEKDEQKENVRHLASDGQKSDANI